MVYLRFMEVQNNIKTPEFAKIIKKNNKLSML